MAKKKLFNQNEHWEVELDSFQGPLDLLLHLIDEYEIDIYDIPIAEITEQYLQYIKAMQSLQLDIAGEYLVMAATLLQIKSEMLVPRNENQSQELADASMDDEDARDNLVQMLLEYKRYKDIVPQFEERQERRSLFLTKIPSDLTQFQDQIPLRPGEISLVDLGQAMSRVIVRYQLLKPQETTIEAEEKTVDEQIEYIVGRLSQTAEAKVSFKDLLGQGTKSEIVVTFLAILELMKGNALKAYQKNKDEDILLVWQAGNEES